MPIASVRAVDSRRTIGDEVALPDLRRGDHVRGRLSSGGLLGGLVAGSHLVHGFRLVVPKGQTLELEARFDAAANSEFGLKLTATNLRTGKAKSVQGSDAAVMKLSARDGDLDLRIELKPAQNPVHTRRNQLGTFDRAASWRYLENGDFELTVR